MEQGLVMPLLIKGWAELLPSTRTAGDRRCRAGFSVQREEVASQNKICTWIYIPQVPQFSMSAQVPGKSNTSSAQPTRVVPVFRVVTCAFYSGVEIDFLNNESQSIFFSVCIFPALISPFPFSASLLHKGKSVKYFAFCHFPPDHKPGVTQRTDWLLPSPLTALRCQPYPVLFLMVSFTRCSNRLVPDLIHLDCGCERGASSNLPSVSKVSALLSASCRPPTLPSTLQCLLPDSPHIYISTIRIGIIFIVRLCDHFSLCSTSSSCSFRYSWNHSFITHTFRKWNWTQGVCSWEPPNILISFGHPNSSSNCVHHFWWQLHEMKHLRFPSEHH